MIETDLVAFLKASNLQATIADRIMPGPAPEDLKDYPCITWQVASYTPEYTCDSGPTGFAQKRLIYHCWADSWLTAHTLLESIRTSLSGYQGNIGSTAVYLVQVANITDYFEPESGLYRASIHLLVQYAE